MSTDLEIPFDRITWRAGQLLTSRDMRDEHRREAWLRRLHHRYVHGTWGIALGYDAAASADSKSVIVQPGYALDAAGHDLMLPKAASVRVPTEANGIFLLALEWRAYRTVKVETCAGAGFSAGGELPRFLWLRPDEYRRGEHVPLARARVQNQTLQGSLDLRVRRYARRSVRPYIAWGSTEPLRTEWKDIVGVNNQPLWLELSVDTSEAGFINTPHYVVSLVRQREGSISNASEKIDPLQHFGQNSTHLLSGLAAIHSATPHHFIYRILRGSCPFGVEMESNDARLAGWSVHWVGLETVAGQEPPASGPIFIFPFL